LVPAKRKKLVLVDGSGYIFRAYYAIRPLTSPKGVPTNAVFGFVNMLLKYLETEKPEYVAVAFDRKAPTFRKERYTEYKSNRDAPPDDLVPQFALIRRFVDAMGIRRLDLDGYEADDLIGTLARRAEKEHWKVDILTGDKDMMQLVSDDVELVDTMRDRRIGPDGVVERFGVRPAQVVDVLALMGDSSDNIPGVTGIGEKTAAELVRTFGSLDGLYARLDEIKQPKRREALTNEKDIAYLSRELATIKCDVDIPEARTWEALKWKGPDAAALRELFTELGFQQMLRRLNLDAASDEAAPQSASAPSASGPAADVVDRSGYVLVRDEEALKALCEALAASERFAFDTETTSLSPRAAKLVGISFATAPGKAYYVPVGHTDEFGTPLPGLLDAGRVREALAPFFADVNKKKIGQNLKYDLQVLRGFGIEVAGVESDTLIASYLLDPTGSHALDTLAQRHLGHTNISYESLTGKGKNQISFAAVPVDKACAYAAEDADVTFRLDAILRPRVVEHAMGPLFHEVEMPLVGVLADMEWRGVQVDRTALEALGARLEGAMAEVQQAIYRHAGGPFNVNSPKQLSEVLFGKLELRVVRRTKTGISTDEAVLTELADEHPICGEILKFRELAKLQSTYVAGLLAQIQPGTGRVHTHFGQTVTATGRLSSSNPNLQNIPVTGEGGKAIRAAFTVPEGKWMLAADYSQIELRVLAHLSGDEALRKAFRDDQDVHEATAREMFKVKTVTPEQRRVAKTINFGVVYGQTPYGLSQTLRIPTGEAKRFIDTYFARYASVSRFHATTLEEARAHGYTATMLGRRRYLPDLHAKNRMVREMAERAAINTPIQGSAADLIKKAMVAIERRLRAERLETAMLLQVHDELVFEVPEGERDRAERIVREEMESALRLEVPLKVDVGWGKNWGEC
jgi:DNA polymerase-1